MTAETRERTSAYAEIGPYGRQIRVEHAGCYVTFHSDTPGVRRFISEEHGCEVEEMPENTGYDSK